MNEHHRGDNALPVADERAWIDRAKAGDQAAFEAIVQRYERQIYAFIFRMMGDADDAYDLAQDSVRRVA